MDRAPTDPESIAAVVARLAERGRVGIVWLDRQLIVQRTYGPLASVAVPGDPVSSGLVALSGQEGRIAALASAGPLAALDLPNVGVVADDAPPVRVNMTVLPDPPAGFVVLIEQVMSQGLAELVVEDANRKRRIADAELSRINRQLEEFTYVISHDLKAPMRALRYYSSDVADALAADEPDLDAARAAATNIQSATRRMSNMLLSLLEFSRVGRQTAILADIDTRALVEDIVGSVGLRDGLSIIIEGDWPMLRAAEIPLDLVLRNLLDNAVKYHDRDTGTIRLIARDASREGARDLVIDVVDDGPGIPQEWHKAIFEPFKRIDDEILPESSGIGLALVKRTLDAEGGRIDVLSDPPTTRGTTFRIIWPQR